MYIIIYLLNHTYKPIHIMVILTIIKKTTVSVYKTIALYSCADILVYFIKCLPVYFMSKVISIILNIASNCRIDLSKSNA